MERISKLLLIVVTVAIVSSCGVSRNKSKYKDVQEVEAAVRVEKKVEESTGALPWPRKRKSTKVW